MRRTEVGVSLLASQGLLAGCECENSGVLRVSAGEHSFMDMNACVCKRSADGVQVQESDSRLWHVTAVGSETGFASRGVRSKAEIADCKTMDIKHMGLVI